MHTAREKIAVVFFYICNRKSKQKLKTERKINDKKRENS